MDSASAIAISLALGAADIAGKTVVEETVKSAYATLKGLIAAHTGSASVNRLEQGPGSRENRKGLEKELAEAGAEKDPNLVAAAEKVVSLVNVPAVSPLIGIEVFEIQAARLRLRYIVTSSLKVHEIKTPGDIDLENIRTSSPMDEDVKKIDRPAAATASVLR
jgi:hypothetical protein